MWVYFNFILSYKFTLSDLSMMREVNLLNRGNANLFVPKSEIKAVNQCLKEEALAMRGMLNHALYQHRMVQDVRET